MRDFFSLAKNYMFYFLWILKGRKNPPHPLFKRKRIKSIAKRYNCETIIETGTADGKTMKYLRKNFKKLLSIEIYEPNYIVASNRLKKYSHIKLFYGDSADLLASMIQDIDGKCLFWLDGHFSGEGTGLGKNECPLKEELKIIKSSGRIGDIILIDDAREFYEHAGYPTIDYVINYLKEINPKFDISIKNDCVIAIEANYI